jgi:hypothetical protein
VYFVNSSLLVKDLSTPTVLARTISLPTLASIALWHIQRDRFENILIARNSYNLIKKVDNQNSFSLASVSASNINLITNLQTLTSYTFANNYTLPQIIPELNICQADKLITSAVTATQDFRVSNLITASSAISNNINVNYRANQILLKPGFIVTGSATGVFKAYIDPCVLGSTARMASSIKNIQASEEDMQLITIKSEPITIYPNPNNGIFKVSLRRIQ